MAFVNISHTHTPKKKPKTQKLQEGKLKLYIKIKAIHKTIALLFLESYFPVLRRNTRKTFNNLPLNL